MKIFLYLSRWWNGLCLKCGARKICWGYPMGGTVVCPNCDLV